MLTAYIAMGANLPSPVGAPETTLAAAVDQLSQMGRVGRCSSLYCTEPVGFRDQPSFVNAVLSLEVGCEPHALLRILLEVECNLGRDRSMSFVNGPRSLDLDLLLMDDRVMKTPELELPHPRLADRAFVLVPLAEIAPNLVHPVRQQTIAQLLAALPDPRESVVCMGKLPGWR